MAKNQKQPKQAKSFLPIKVARSKQPPNYDNENVIWCFSIFDELNWREGEKPCEDLFTDVACALRDFARRRWREIEANAKHDHPVSRDRLTKKAQDRLVELKLDDNEEFWRFRFSGERRLWGIRRRGLFEVLWWDPEHEICPSEKKHT